MRVRGPKENHYSHHYSLSAPCVTVNLSIEKKIVNGILVEYHSISFLDKNFGSEVFETIRCYDHGSVITIEHPPDFSMLNYILTFMATKTPPQ